MPPPSTERLQGTGSLDSQDARARADIRLGHRTTNPAGLTRATPGWTRIAESRSRPARSEALDSIGMGPTGGQPPRQVRLIDPARPQADGIRMGELQAHGRCNRAGPRGELTCR